MSISLDRNGRKFPLAISVLSLVLLVSVALCSCRHNPSAGAAREEAGAPDRLGAYLDAYWENIDPDTLTAEAREQRIVDYIYLTLNADTATRRQCWQAIAGVFPDEQPNRTVTDYLGEPDSPLYAPGMLEEYLDAISALYEEGSLERYRVDYLLDGIRKNKIGQQISDLDVINVADGMPATLHALIRRCDTDVRVLFYDPGCEECAAVISRLAGEPGTVIAVSITGDTHSALAAGAVPQGWYSCTARDLGQLDGNFYLPRLPQLYTVGSNGIIKF